MNKIVILIIVALLVIISEKSHAQSNDSLKIKSTFDEGYLFIGEDDLLKVKGYAQTDFYSPMFNGPGTSEFQIRRARLAVTGYFQEHFRYMLYGRFDRGKAQLNEVFLESRHLSFARIRIGQFKVPFSQSNLISSSKLGLMDRPLVIDNFSPQYDIGLMLFGTIWRERIEYATGIFNGQQLNQPEDNKEKDFVARVVVSPFVHYRINSLKNFYLGVSLSRGENSDPFQNRHYKTGSGIQFYSLSDSTINKCKLQNIGGDIEWMLGAFSLKAEYLQTVYQYNDIITHTITNKGYNIDLSLFLTGEKQMRNDLVKPNSSFDPANGKWGALEIAARYEILSMSKNLFQFSKSIGANNLSCFTGGINWYPNDDVKIALNYQRIDFNPSILINGEYYSTANLLKVRVQYQF